MRAMTVMILIAGFGLLSLTGAAGTDSPDANATVELLVHTDLAGATGLAPGEPDALIGTASCSVTIESGSDAGDVLDQAVEDGCILEWDSDDFDGARFVVSVDGLRAEGTVCIAWPIACQFWEIRINDQEVSFGIDDYNAADGDQVEFLFHTI